MPVQVVSGDGLEADDDDLFTTGAPQVVQAARLALRVPMRDRYHRGHITHTKYDYRTAGR